jgi:group II intron reverse transcriptase/maturase
MAETLSSTTVSTKLERIAKLAREVPQAALTTLAHHIDIDWLREAYRRTRKNGATGVDRQTAAEYASNLESNLRSLLQRAKSGSYVAPPVRRVHIPKGEGSQTRPIGIPTFEDKVLQRAVAMVLEAVYEQSFLDCSYGFRPGRSAHQALRLVQNQTVKMAGKWVLEIDIRKFFDSLDHSQLRNIVRKRVRDGVLLRLIGKWLNAGVMEDGALEYPEAGTPQGGVISPLLANIYLHEVLDEWFARQVAPRLGGRAVLVRYADDVVIIFEQEQDARRVIDVLPKRLAKYGLMLHPEKTRLVDFRRPDRRDSDRHLRPAGVHPLLGDVPQGILGGEAEDRCGPFPARPQAHRGLVSALPP